MTSTVDRSRAVAMTGGSRARLTQADCKIDEFAELVAQTADLADFPHAARVDHNVLVYDAAAVVAALTAASGAQLGADALEAELVRAFSDGPGVVLFERAFPDHTVIDRVTATFDAIIADEHRRGGPSGDHFATPGANSRVWNALEKLAVRDPDAFVDYYANDIIAFASRSWLGPGYQMTSQVNVVRPGGTAQAPHRDYHLGFLTSDVVERFPAHVHLLSPLLTLQGAVAHCDMPIESGPTTYLPYSHQYPPGYVAWRLPEFRAHFDGHHVQLPLSKGDAVFFNPAVFHGAGTNSSANVQRVANLLQVSSAFGQAMELVDRRKVAKAIYPALQERHRNGGRTAAVDNAIAAAASGYPFPTNLDRDQPIGGLTPPTQIDVLQQALDDGWEPALLDDALDAYDARHNNDDIR
jgi:ectoine hydroxylase-related dioxygenase (phytanoyl-CoA dioxygenase family)